MDCNPVFGGGLFVKPFIIDGVSSFSSDTLRDLRLLPSLVNFIRLFGFVSVKAAPLGDVTEALSESKSISALAFSLSGKMISKLVKRCILQIAQQYEDDGVSLSFISSVDICYA